MTQFNPLAGSILQSGQIARQQSAIKTAQMRRNQQLQRNVAARDDEMEHQVESSEEVMPIHDPEEEGTKGQWKKKNKDDEEPHIDLKA
jgi:hypothetical protein